MEERIIFAVDKELKRKIEERTKELGLQGVASYLRMIALKDLRKAEREDS